MLIGSADRDRWQARVPVPDGEDYVARGRHWLSQLLTALEELSGGGMPLPEVTGG